MQWVVYFLKKTQLHGVNHGGCTVFLKEERQYVWRVENNATAIASVIGDSGVERLHRLCIGFLCSNFPYSLIYPLPHLQYDIWASTTKFLSIRPKGKIYISIRLFGFALKFPNDDWIASLGIRRTATFAKKLMITIKCIFKDTFSHWYGKIRWS